MRSIVARLSIWTHLTSRDAQSQTQVVVEVLVFLAFGILGCWLNVCWDLSLSSLRSLHLIRCPFFFRCSLLLLWGVGQMSLCLVFHTHGIVRTACVTGSCTVLAVGWCLGVMVVVCCVLFWICFSFWHVCALKVCAAQFAVLCWVRWRVIVSRRELFTTVAECFCVSKFWCLVPPVLSFWVCSEVWLVSHVFWLLTSSMAFHNGVWLWVMLYKFPRRSPGWRFTAGFK